MDDNDENHTRDNIYYPSLFPITLTHSEFPSDHIVHDHVSMTYGLLVTPFIALEDGSSLCQYNPNLQSLYRTTGIARCDDCGGYINPFCDVTTMRWLCSLCETRNIFTRNMKRYRSIDMKLLPEMQQLMIDYPLPLHTTEVDQVLISKKKKIKGNNIKKNKLYYCSANERPLVHVFLIQESMSLDCIQAVIDGISHATSPDPNTGLHPDVEVILLTFSNRIGIYRLHCDEIVSDDSNILSKINDITTTKSTYLLPSCVQYCHFSIDNVLNDVDKLSYMKSNDEDDENNGGIFEGQNDSAFLSLASSMSDSTRTTTTKVTPLLSLNEIASFDDIRVPIGQVRQSLRTSLSALYDASPSVTTNSSGVNKEYDVYGQQVNSCESENLHGPLVMLGTCSSSFTNYF